MTAWLRKVIETLTPDATSILDVGGSLVLAPHPDDEVLGCGGIIARKIQRGTHVSIVYLTDGRRGVSVPAEEGRALREAEAVQAAAALGVPVDRLTFLRFEDGRLSEYIEQATEKVRQIISASSVDALFVPYRREFHADHQAAWRIGAACCQDRMRLYEYPIWYGPWLWRRLEGRSRLAAVVHLADLRYAMKANIERVVDVKRHALAAHQSQVTAFAAGPWGPRFLSDLIGNYELFFSRQ